MCTFLKGAFRQEVMNSVVWCSGHFKLLEKIIFKGEHLKKT